jgi:hypothetical protein
MLELAKRKEMINNLNQQVTQALLNIDKLLLEVANAKVKIEHELAVIHKANYVIANLPDEIT